LSCNQSIGIEPCDLYMLDSHFTTFFWDISSFIRFCQKAIFATLLIWTQEERTETKYSWNEYEINLILGSFFWGYICTEIPGGRLAEIIGTRRVFGYSMLMSSLITLLIPLMASFGYVMIVVLRVILGFMLVCRHFPIIPVVSVNIIWSVPRAWLNDLHNPDWSGSIGHLSFFSYDQYNYTHRSGLMHDSARSHNTITIDDVWQKIDSFCKSGYHLACHPANDCSMDSTDGT